MVETIATVAHLMAYTWVILCFTYVIRVMYRKLMFDIKITSKIKVEDKK